MRNISTIALGPIDDSTNQNGTAFDTNQWVSASFQAVFGDATAAGTFKLQASNDVCAPQLSSTFTVTNWTDIPTQTATVAAGASAILTVANCSYRWMRAVWTHSGGGSTTITVTVNALSV